MSLPEAEKTLEELLGAQFVAADWTCYECVHCTTRLYIGKGRRGFGRRLQLVRCANLLLESEYFRYRNGVPEVIPSRSIALIVFERRGQIKARVIPMCGKSYRIDGVMFRGTKPSRP